MTNEKHEDRAHAKYAPSAASRWMTCKGSVNLAIKLDAKDRESSYAREGTECHEAASAILMGESWAKATKGLSEQQLDIVEQYTEYAFDLIDKLQERYGADKVKVWIEERVGEGDFAGTADLLILAGRTLAVIDLKAGHGPVTVRDPDTKKLNPQLASYGVLALGHHLLWDKVDHVRLTVVQPRVYDKPQTEIVLTQELWDFSQDVAQAIEAIEAGEPTLIPGKHCGFCPARGKCPELRKEAVEKAKIVFGSPKVARDYTPEELADIADEAMLIQAHIDGVMMHIRNELEKGRKIRGWKLVPKRAVAKWTDFEPVKKALGGYSYSEIFRLTPRTPGQIQKLITEDGVKFDIAPYFVKESSGTTLARETDARPAVKHDPFNTDEK